MLVINYFLVSLQFFALVLARAQADEYATDPNIYELTPSTFDKVVHKTNYTSIVKFYAPWCGYCQQLKPVFTKLGKLIHKDGQYAANVAAVNCDKEYNKPLCAKYQISGFPTLLVFRPPKHTDGQPLRKNEKHVNEVYNGERSLKAMASFLTSRLKNYSKRIPGFGSETFKSFVDEDEDYGKFVLISKSQSVSPLFRSLAIDFLNSVKFGLISSKALKGTTVTLEGQEVEIPKGENGEIEIPSLLYINKSSGEVLKYDRTPKLNDKLKISEWIVEVSKKTPSEGPLSKKEKKYYSSYRSGKKAKKAAPDHDEL
ncbi:thioredoxin-like protein [Scheffersomyces xylosifermentans]|uniref:thioredoxin-like protein n=1 Tax=Scheffersomyces xylosifermentans TaxID=1304137 RepID=UPI00315DC94B